MGEWTYQSYGMGTSWLKIKNHDYTQIVSRSDLFEAGFTASSRHSTRAWPRLR